MNGEQEMTNRNWPIDGRTLICIGMFSLLLAAVVPRLIPARVGSGWIDAMRGFFYGVAIAANLRGVQLNCRQRRCNSA
jgi:hypothetical protein